MPSYRYNKEQTKINEVELQAHIKAIQNIMDQYVQSRYITFARRLLHGVDKWMFKALRLDDQLDTNGNAFKRMPKNKSTMKGKGKL